ncbi:MAG: flagellar biosynthetic protein FliR [Burkholderiales bacterium]|nr:flagellar biosynthetic protein FliR [Burkholderiales bacterium]
MLSFSSAALDAWLAGVFWPLARILALCSSAPVLANPAVPRRVRVGFAAVLTVLVVPTLPAPPPIPLASVAGLLLLAEQVAIGVAIGFAMRLVLAAVELAGSTIGLQMGLGLATLFDPQNGAQSPVMGSFLGFFATLVFLAIDGHLLLVDALVRSFAAFPVATGGLAIGEASRIAALGATLFTIGLHLALPVLAAMLVTNLALGVLTRSAPQLNLFSVGFPAALLVGFAALTLSLPSITAAMERYLLAGVSLVVP